VLEEGGTNHDATALIASLVSGDGRVPFAAADRAMLDYALKLTHTPGRITAEDVAALRGAGFDDRAIHDICAIAAYFAFVNRIADGLGVELERIRSAERPSD
jgi:uncharacterized peroxidase-related enzyme